MKRFVQSIGVMQTRTFSAAAMFAVKYQGIWPAPGYPYSPTIRKRRPCGRLDDIERHTGIGLTESLSDDSGGERKRPLLSRTRVQVFARSARSTRIKGTPRIAQASG